MKKLIAILLSALMLCALIPFATVAVSAEEGINIILEVSEEQVNAGEEFEVTVILEGNPGLISADITITYDTDAIELVGEWDGADFYPEISSPRKWKANGFTYGPDETRCTVIFTLGTSSNITEEEYFTALFVAKDDAYTGDYDLTVSYDPNNYFGRGEKDGEFIKYPILSVENGSISINGKDPEPDVPACEHEYEYDCSKVCSKCGEETRPEAEHQYFYACDPVCMICYEMTNPEAAHTMNHVEAKPATCTENGNIEYWYCDACGGCWDNENAMGMPLNRMMVIVPAAHTYDNDCDPDCNVCFENREELNHNVIHVEAVPATCTTEGNIEYWYCDVCGMAWLDEACTLNTNLLSVKLPASCSYGAVYTAAKAATCFEPGNVEYWYCANCDVYYADAACAIVTNAKNVIIPITHNVIHVEAKAPTCTENGNIEYWYCADCGQAWLDEYCHLNTNLKAVVLGATCSTNAVYTEAKAATCFEPGNVEYWYCANCDVYYLDAACTIITNAKNVIIPITHNIIHVVAKDATCFEPGNIEYWYCDVCGAAWTDELCREVTNLKNVVLPIAHNVIHVEAKDATCTELGNIEYWYCADCGQAWLDELCHLNTNLKAVVLPMADHTYSGECDATCNACGAEREVTLPAAPVAFGGNSISENKNGLAFLFTADVDGIIISEDYKADYSNATVIINGEEHKLVAMGAIMNNKGYADQTLENVDGKYVLNVKANKVFDASSYAIRIVNIPAENLDTIITARSYITYECGGELITIYGEDIATSYNAELG